MQPGTTHLHFHQRPGRAIHPAHLPQNEKDALLRLAGSNEEAGFAERFQHFLITRQQEAGPEGGQLWHMRPARPEEQRCQRLCQRLLTALALRALLQEVRCAWRVCAGRMGGASCQT